MFGRAGRRGLDETGFVLITANELRLLRRPSLPPLPQRRGGLGRAARPDGRRRPAGPRSLRAKPSASRNACSPPSPSSSASRNRCGIPTCPAACGPTPSAPATSASASAKCSTAAANGRPCPRARSPMPLQGHPHWRFTDLPTDAPHADRTRRARRSYIANRELVHSAPSSPIPPPWRRSAPAPSASCPKTEQGKIYGRALTVADRLGDDRVLLAKWIRRLTNWNGRQAPLAVWEEKIVPLVREKLAAAEDARGHAFRTRPSASSPWSAWPS